LVDMLGDAPLSPNGPTPPFTRHTDSRGCNYVRVAKCHVLIFYGHGIASKGPIDFENLSEGDRNKSRVPALVTNEPCSAAEVFGCNTGNYVYVQCQTAGAENPASEVKGNKISDIDGLWNRARAQARAICKSKNCCETVKIRFECALPWSQRPDDCG